MISLKVKGEIPEKDYVDIRRDGSVTKTAGLDIWNENIREHLQTQNKKTYLETDIEGEAEFGANTPLRADLYINTTKRTNIIKQCKALFDCLSGYAYTDDRTICELNVYRTLTDANSFDLYLSQPNKKNFELPSSAPIVHNGYFRSIQDTARDEQGFSLNNERKQKDLDFRKALQDDFKQSGYTTLDADKEWELSALVEVKSINVGYPLFVKQAMLHHDYMPNCKPDSDNIAYTIARAYYNLAFTDIQNLSELHIVKVYGPEKSLTQKIWIQEALC